ncbi:MAG: hypothetical protein H6850_03540 [Alphaproteobacteria bacterium]|nr:MAG: hypothetical protein H6850_03540 [Alphaproteobacteria bacterium]
MLVFLFVNVLINPNIGGSRMSCNIEAKDVADYRFLEQQIQLRLKF